MKTILHSNPDFRALYSECGKICVSIIVPTHKLSPERQSDKLVLSKAVDEAKKQLNNHFGVYHTDPVVDGLDELFNMVDFDHNEEGIGLFVSESRKLMVKFPFPVKERIIVSNRFEIRDLLVAERYNTPFLVLSLNEQEARLYQGKMAIIREIKDGFFPAKYIDDYEYNPPGKVNFFSGSSVVQQYEKDKSAQVAIHIKKFLQGVDEKLTPYLAVIPDMILMAPKKELAWYSSITRHGDHLISTVHGNFQHTSLHEVEAACWTEMKQYLDLENKHEFDEFREKIGQKHAVFGLDEVWKSAREGRALRLLVEKDFMMTAFTDEQGYELQVTPGAQSEKELPDAVDDLIRLVLDKNGGVCFTENDQLKDYDRIALITRY